MAMRMGGAHGGNPMALMRSMRRDDGGGQEASCRRGRSSGSPGSPRPTATPLAVFLVLIIVDALISAANPLLYRAIIDDGILKHDAAAGGRPGPGGGRPGRRRRRPITLAQRWISVPHRRGPHLRHAHPGLRPHRPDAARLLHPDPDRRPGLPAQQRRARRPGGVHQHLLLGGRQPAHRRRHPGGHVLPLVADHPAGAGHPAGVPVPGPVDRAAPGQASPATATTSTPR